MSGPSVIFDPVFDAWVSDDVEMTLPIAGLAAVDIGEDRTLWFDALLPERPCRTVLSEADLSEPGVAALFEVAFGLSASRLVAERALGIDEVPIGEPHAYRGVLARFALAGQLEELELAEPRRLALQLERARQWALLLDGVEGIDVLTEEALGHDSVTEAVDTLTACAVDEVDERQRRELVDVADLLRRTLADDEQAGRLATFIEAAGGLPTGLDARPPAGARVIDDQEFLASLESSGLVFLGEPLKFGTEPGEPVVSAEVEPVALCVGPSDAPVRFLIDSALLVGTGLVVPPDALMSIERTGEHIVDITIPVDGALAAAGTAELWARAVRVAADGRPEVVVGAVVARVDEDGELDPNGSMATARLVVPTWTLQGRPWWVELTTEPTESAHGEFVRYLRCSASEVRRAMGKVRRSRASGEDLDLAQRALGRAANLRRPRVPEQSDPSDAVAEAIIIAVAAAIADLESGDPTVGDGERLRATQILSSSAKDGRKKSTVADIEELVPRGWASISDAARPFLVDLFPEGLPFRGYSAQER